jgi:hypothetical protein
MLLFPEVQVRAHEEIYTVLRGERLPGFEDRPNLLYCEALMLETMR